VTQNIGATGSPSTYNILYPGGSSNKLRFKSVNARLASDGPLIVEVTERAPDDPQTGPLGNLVRTGSFTTQAAADELRAELTAKGYTGLRTVNTGEDGDETSGPWVVHVLEINPDLYDGKSTPELATEIVPERETLTSISDRTDSLAAINGGYFMIGENDGTSGDLAGMSVIDGTLARARTSRPSRTP